MKRASGMSYLQVTIRKGAGGKKIYTKDDCDIIVVSHEEKLWVIPIEETLEYKTLLIECGQLERRSDRRKFDAKKYRVL